MENTNAKTQPAINELDKTTVQDTIKNYEQQLQKELNEEQLKAFKKRFKYLKLTKREVIEKESRELLLQAFRDFENCEKIKGNHCPNKGNAHLNIFREPPFWTKSNKKVLGKLIGIKMSCAKSIDKEDIFKLRYSNFIIYKPNWFKYADEFPQINQLPINKFQEESFEEIRNDLSELYENEKNHKENISFFNLQKVNFNHEGAKLLLCDFVERGVKTALLYSEEFVSRFDRAYWKVDDYLDLINEANVIIFVSLGEESFVSKNYILFLTRLFDIINSKRKDVYFFSTEYNEKNGLIQAFQKSIHFKAKWVNSFFEQLNYFFEMKREEIK
ncbi:MPN526 family protein [Mycoplasmoides pneumoniae]|uniref:MPN526 family protein n=1 Tax=Mycoplasmoides pneumoniae TaxID=2104 RepID=UPI0006BA6A9C|nr:hypothetical protein [Mycoplasmoides pneumoniae]